LVIGVEDQQIRFGCLLSLNNPKANANQASCNRAAKCCEWKTHFGAPGVGNARTWRHYTRIDRSKLLAGIVGVGIAALGSLAATSPRDA
jgi:hypothetical protein